ncbi:hypothetical protein CLF_111327 [Clonorchis sinensis]|uniref:Uncharacterized protein n=1 Tax=Clonorchis sinensis TaxID=79923 RepID=G7YUM8_CLOSI|nr:hypothetical protein CLF_111327 [Clonorchis sinensis]
MSGEAFCDYRDDQSHKLCCRDLKLLVIDQISWIGANQSHRSGIQPTNHTAQTCSDVIIAPSVGTDESVRLERPWPRDLRDKLRRYSQAFRNQPSDHSQTVLRSMPQTCLSEAFCQKRDGTDVREDAAIPQKIHARHLNAIQKLGYKVIPRHTDDAVHMKLDGYEKTSGLSGLKKPVLQRQDLVKTGGYIAGFLTQTIRQAKWISYQVDRILRQTNVLPLKLQNRFFVNGLNGAHIYGKGQKFIEVNYAKSNVAVTKK